MPRREPRSSSSYGRGARGRAKGQPKAGQTGRKGQHDVRKGNPQWGGVARRGAARDMPRSKASEAWREAGKKSRGVGAPPTEGHPRAEESQPAAPWEPEEWIDEGAVRDEAQRAVGRGGGGSRGGRGGERRPSAGGRASGGNGGPRTKHDVGGAESDAAPTEELRAAVGSQRAERLEQRLESAGDAFRRGRFEEARRTLRPLAESAPSAASVRELYGLTLYRLGRWKQASRELEAFRTRTGSVEQHPVLADCYRALGRYEDVEELWDELRAASPGAALVAEGRIVAAGALADQGRVDEAIARLSPGVRPARRAQEHHLRVAYALADLYERAGDLPRAREMFERVAASAPDFVDVGARLRSLG